MEHRVAQIKAARDFDQLVHFRVAAKDLWDRFREEWRLLASNGSGLSAAECLRVQALEINNRLARHGAYSLPTSFNIAEAFLEYVPRSMFFRIRMEREYLASSSEFTKWLQIAGFPDRPSALIDIIEERYIYSYNFTDRTEIKTGPADEPGRYCTPVNVSLIRHGQELSTISEWVEVPGIHIREPGAADASTSNNYKKSIGHEHIESAADLGPHSANVEGFPGGSRVLICTRVDLRSEIQDVTYVYVDRGASYRVITDDTTIYDPSTPKAEMQSFISQGRSDLEHYSQAIAFVLSSLYLPAYCVSEYGHTTHISFPTDLYRNRKKFFEKRTIKQGLPQAVTERDVAVVLPRPLPDSLPAAITPPITRQESTGRWKPLPPNEVGRDKIGSPVAGKTWESHTVEWKSETVTDFIARRRPNLPVGSDPGWIYVMKSSAHKADIFKVGLTRRTPEERAKELSQDTGSPAQFDVLASWATGDCKTAEKLIHDRLGGFRINPDREFFECPIETIISTARECISGLDRPEAPPAHFD